MANPDVENSEKSYVVFLIAGNEYGVNVKALNLIIDPLEDFSLGHSINIRNDSLNVDDKEIPFINLYDLFNIKSPAHSKDTRIIVVNIKEHTTAFYVERAKEFISFDTKDSILLEFISIPEEPLIKWKIKYSDRNILLPDFDKILAEII